MRHKTCKNCKSKFQPERSFQDWCSFDCGVELARKRLEAKKKKEHKEARKKYRQAKEAIKSRSDWMKEAQAAFNTYIRERDKDLPCISCQRYHNGQYHAGHYRTTKAAPELRFSENNVHKQCSSCNNHMSGNLIEYRKNLILKVGFDMVEFLESNHPPKHYSIDDLKEIKALYKQKLKELNNK